MLLESHLDDKTILVIDAESVGGIDKGAMSVQGHPDKIVDSAMHTIRVIAARLGTAATVDAASPPDSMEVSFGVRVDSNAIVSMSRTPDDGQLRVTLRWQAAGR